MKRVTQSETPPLNGMQPRPMLIVDTTLPKQPITGATFGGPPRARPVGALSTTWVPIAGTVIVVGDEAATPNFEPFAKQWSS